MTLHFLKWSFGPKIESVDGICRQTDSMNIFYLDVKVAVNTIVPRSPFFLFLYLKTQTVTHIRKKAVEYLRQWNGAICVIYNLCQRQNIS